LDRNAGTDRELQDPLAKLSILIEYTPIPANHASWNVTMPAKSTERSASAIDGHSKEHSFRTRPAETDSSIFEIQSTIDGRFHKATTKCK
jgi:hypothetical protein